jgi:hypothetical protein
MLGLNLAGHKTSLNHTSFIIHHQPI